MEVTRIKICLHFGHSKVSNRLRARASVCFDDCFIVHDIKIIEAPTGRMVVMPSHAIKAPCPHCGVKNPLNASFCNECGQPVKAAAKVNPDTGRIKLYSDTAHPTDQATRDRIATAVLNAFDAEWARHTRAVALIEPTVRELTNA